MTKKLIINNQFTLHNNLLQNLEIDEAYFINLLLEGDLYAFEEALYKLVMTQIYDALAAAFIQDVVSNPFFVARMPELARSQRMGKLQKRVVNLQLRTGTFIKVETHYARVAPKTVVGSRYLCFRYWGIIDRASPSYYAQVSKFSVLCGSFEIVKEVLGGLQIGGNVKRIRSLALAVAKKCLLQRVTCMLGKDDNLAGNRFLIGSIWALHLTGGVFSIATMVGFISLVGITSRNGIMMISHYLHLMKEEGEDFTEEMIIRGSLERLVPVMMTALTAGLSLLPLVIAADAPGKEILHPLVVVVLGGILTSTLLDQIVTPAVFYKFGKPSADRIIALRKGISGQKGEWEG